MLVPSDKILQRWFCSRKRWLEYTVELFVRRRNDAHGDDWCVCTADFGRFLSPHTRTTKLIEIKCTHTRFSKWPYTAICTQELTRLAGSISPSGHFDYSFAIGLHLSWELPVCRFCSTYNCINSRATKLIKFVILTFGCFTRVPFYLFRLLRVGF